MSSLVVRATTYAATGLVSQAAALLLWMFIPWYLPPSEVGFLALALFAVELLTMLGSLGMDAALVRYAGKSAARGAFFGIALVFAGAAFFLLVSLLPLGSALGRYVFASTAAWVADHYTLVVVAVAANISWNLVQSLLTAGLQAKEYALLQIVRAGVQQVLGFCALTYFPRDAATVLLALTIGTIGVLGLLLRSVRLPAIPANPFASGNGREMARYGLSMLVYGVLGVALNYTQRLVMDNYASIAAVGVFAFFNVIVLQANGLWNALAKAWMPEYYALVESDRPAALDLLRGMLVLACVIFPLALALGMALCEAGLIALLLPAAYADRTVILWPLALSLLFSGVYAIASPMYYHVLRARLILGISAFLAIANLAFSVLFIKWWGTEGAAGSFYLLMVLTAWTYLAVYRDWADGRLPAVLVAVTIISSAAVIILLVTGAVWLFAGLLCATSALAWSLGAPAARPLVRRFAQRFRRAA